MPLAVIRNLPLAEIWLAVSLLAAPSVIAMDTAPVAAGSRSVLESTLREAERQLDLGERETAESLYRTLMLEGWMVLGSLEADEGRWREARTAYQRASRAAVETRRALTALASADLRLGDTSAAITTLRQVVGEYPADPAARRLLARALVDSGDTPAAIQELEELLANAPGDVESAYILANAYLGQGRPEAAEPLFSQLVEARPGAGTHVLIGRTYRDHGEYAHARRALEKALELDPEIERAHFYLGTIDLLEEGLGRMAQATEHFRQELRVAPDAPRPNLYLGMALTENRAYAEALTPLEKASRDPRSRGDALQFLGRCYLALDRLEDTVVALREALDLAADRAAGESTPGMSEVGENQLAAVHYQLAQALRRLGREDEAAEHFAAAKQSSARLAESSRETLTRYLGGETTAAQAAAPPLADPSGLGELDPATRRELRQSVRRILARSYFNLGVLKLRSSRFSPAAELLQQAAQLDPELPGVHASLGTAYFNANRFLEATEPLDRALAEGGEDPNLSRMLALAWLNAGRYAQAAALLAVDGGRTSNPSLQYAYGLALSRSGRSAEAQTIFEDLLTRNADWPELNVVLGQAYAKQGNYAAAESFLERALELDPQVAEAHATLGEMHLRQGELEEAERALSSELASHPQDLRTRYTLATVLDLAGEAQEAIGHLDRILAADPRSANARYLKGKLLLAAGAAEEALEQLTAAAALSPEEANIRYQLAQTLRALGRDEESNREFETYRRLKAEERSGDGR